MSGVVLFKTMCTVVSIVINAPSGFGCGWSNAWGLIAVRLLPGGARVGVVVVQKIGVFLGVRLWGSPGTRNGLLGPIGLALLGESLTCIVKYNPESYPVLHNLIPYVCPVSQ